MARPRSPEELERLRKEILEGRDPSRTLLTVNIRSACGLAAGSEEVAERLREEMEKRGMEGKVELRRTGCNGFCQMEPVVTVYPSEIFYVRVKSEDVSELVEGIERGRVVERFLFQDPLTGQRIESPRSPLLPPPEEDPPLPEKTEYCRVCGYCSRACPTGKIPPEGPAGAFPSVYEKAEKPLPSKSSI
jgi:NADH-quinone oxidoreductase subunit F